MKRKLFATVMLMSITALCIFGLTACKSDKDPNIAEFRKGFDAYIEECNKDGTVKELTEFWYAYADIGKDLDFSALTGEKGTITMGTNISKPFSYMRNNQWTGITIELIYNYCKDNGYDLDIVDYSNSNALVLAASGGKIDIGGASVSITEERKKSVDFSPSYYDNSVIVVSKNSTAANHSDVKSLSGLRMGTQEGTIFANLTKDIIPDIESFEYNSISDVYFALENDKVDFIVVDLATFKLVSDNYSDIVIFAELNSDDHFGYVYAKSGGGCTDLISSVKSSFNRTFIEDNRWMLLLQGICNTLIISLSSILLGSALGFIVFLMCRKGNKLANGITSFFMWIIDGLPTVVLLMILYYIVFGSTDLNSIIVSITAFTLVFAASTFSSLKNAVSSVDRGQYEVSYALGYSDRKTFFKIILPQAARLFWPPFKGSVRALVKATAIVGYIAALDLTRAGDIIRSNTYEALFPLLSVAVIYFILGWIMTSIVGIFDANSKPSEKKTERYLKGVDIHD